MKKWYFILLVSVLVGITLFAAGCSKGATTTTTATTATTTSGGAHTSAQRRGHRQSRLHFKIG